MIPVALRVILENSWHTNLSGPQKNSEFWLTD